MLSNYNFNKPALMLYLWIMASSPVRAQLPGVIDLGDFGEDVRILSNVDLELFGSDLASGDFNADGYDDILVGAYGAKNDEGYMAGRAYIIFGGPRLYPYMNLRERKKGFTVIHGDDRDDYTGLDITVADINGDGIEDAIIGADQNFHVVGKGTVYVVYGRQEWPAAIDLDTDGGPVAGVTRILGREPQNFFSSSLSAGDINGDGYCDLVIGAFGAGPFSNEGREGEIYVLYGSDFFDAVVELSDAQVSLTTIYGTTENTIGSFNGCADVNGDGFADVLVGVPLYSSPGRRLCGRVVVIYGGQTMPESIDLDDIDAGNFPATIILGEESYDRIGWRFDGGDVNGDGFTDLLIGASAITPDWSIDYGKMHVVFGAASWPNFIDLKSYPEQLKIEAEVGHFGYDVASGDVNGDSFADILVGDEKAKVGNIAPGKVFVVYGESGVQGTKDLKEETELSRATQIWGYRPDVQDLGQAIAAGDVNGDGIDDIIVSGYETQTPGGTLSGEVYVIYGRSRPNSLPAGTRQQLLPTYPNPFNSSTVVSFRLEQAQNIRLSIYNSVGQEVRRLADGWKEAGEHTAIWDGYDSSFSQVSSGVYFCYLRGEIFKESQKILLLR